MTICWLWHLQHLKWLTRTRPWWQKCESCDVWTVGQQSISHWPRPQRLQTRWKMPWGPSGALWRNRTVVPDTIKKSIWLTKHVHLTDLSSEECPIFSFELPSARQVKAKQDFSRASGTWISFWAADRHVPGLNDVERFNGQAMNRP